MEETVCFKEHTITFFSLLTSSSDALYSSSSFCIDSATVGKGLKKRRQVNNTTDMRSTCILFNSNEFTVSVMNGFLKATKRLSARGLKWSLLKFKIFFRTTKPLH